MDLAMKNDAIQKIALAHPEILAIAFDPFMPFGEKIDATMRVVMNDPEIVRHAVGNDDLMRLAMEKPKIIEYAMRNPDVVELLTEHSPEFRRKIGNGGVEKTRSSFRSLKTKPRKTKNGDRILPLFLAKALIFGAPAIAGMFAQG